MRASRARRPLLLSVIDLTPKASDEDAEFCSRCATGLDVGPRTNTSPQGGILRCSCLWWILIVSSQECRPSGSRLRFHTFPRLNRTWASEFRAFGAGHSIWGLPYARDRKSVVPRLFRPCCRRLGT